MTILQQQMQKRYLKVKEAHQYLNIGDDTFPKVKGKRKDKAHHNSGIERFDRKELDRFMELNQ